MTNLGLQLKTQRLYRQTIRQSQFTNLPYTVMALYKFALLSTSDVPKVKAVNWLAFTIKKKPYNRYQIFTHFLFNWFTKQLLSNTHWESGSQQWRGTASNSNLSFYLLRYNFFPHQKLYPFVPTTGWSSLYPRQTALLNLPAHLSYHDLPFPFEDYFTLEFADFYRLGFQVRSSLNRLAPRWYSKVFLLRSFHYPVVYDVKQLPVLHALSLVPLKVPYVFDELATARFSMDTRKKRLLMVFKAFLKIGRHRSVLTEYNLQYRLKEQLFVLSESSPAAQFFLDKWLDYFSRRASNRNNKGGSKK